MGFKKGQKVRINLPGWNVNGTYGTIIKLDHRGERWIIQPDAWQDGACLYLLPEDFEVVSENEYQKADR